jgi:hypothetical protein
MPTMEIKPQTLENLCLNLHTPIICLVCSLGLVLIVQLGDGEVGLKG